MFLGFVVLCTIVVASVGEVDIAIATDFSSRTLGEMNTRSSIHTSTRGGARSVSGDGACTTGKGKDNLVVRFYFIRHGETQDNLDGIVTGQMDSTLTELGIKQAQTAGQHQKHLPHSGCWRQYTSDLIRAINTAQIILQGLHLPSAIPEILRIDQRLRERAKGVREGRSKNLTFDQALEVYHADNVNMNSGSDNIMKDLPLYEKEEDVWERVQDWLFEVVGDAVRQYSLECAAADVTRVVKTAQMSSSFTNKSYQNKDPLSSSPLLATASIIESSASSLQQISKSKMYSVFVVSHSGSLRAIIRGLVGSQLPSSIDLTPAGKDGAKPGMLYIPNTSVTVIDIVPNNLNEAKKWEHEERIIGSGSVDYSDLWSANLVELTRADHLENM